MPDKNQDIRAFIAIRIPQKTLPVIESLIRKLQPMLSAARFVRTDNIHLTLHFFGSISVDRIEAVKQALREVAIGQAPVSMKIGGLGFFPDKHRPRVLWVGVTEGSDAIIQLAGNVENAINRYGFAKGKRPFIPHITLARIKKPKQPRINDVLRIGQSFNTDPFIIDELTLIQSTLHPDGPGYTVLETFQLDG